MKKTDGQRLRVLRDAFGITQKELADLIGYDERTVQRWEAAGLRKSTFDAIQVKLENEVSE